MEAILLMLMSAVVGAVSAISVQRFQATWLKRRDTAAEAYAAAVAVHSAVLSSLALARRIDAVARANPHEAKQIAHSSDWNVTGQLSASKARLDKLREAKLDTRAIWGTDVAALFDDYFELTSAWHNALGAYHDGLSGIGGDPDDSDWERDETGFDWNGVIAGTPPHSEAFDRELEQLTELVRRFARSAGVAITDLIGLPQGVREVVGDYEDHKQRRQIAARCRAALPPPK